MLSVVIQALKKPVMFLCMLCTPFANRCLVYGGWAFEITHNAWVPKLSSPDKFIFKFKFIWIYSLGPRIWTWDCREQIQLAVRAGLELASPTALTTRSRWVRSIQPKFPEISVQNSMDWFGPSGKVSKKLVHLLRWTTFPGRTGRNFGWELISLGFVWAYSIWKSEILWEIGSLWENPSIFDNEELH